MQRQVMQQDGAIREPSRKLASHVRFVPTDDGMRIDLVDDADYSMFAIGTTALDPRAAELIGMIAESIRRHRQPDHDPRAYRQRAVWRSARDEQLDALDRPRGSDAAAAVARAVCRKTGSNGSRASPTASR